MTEAKIVNTDDDDLVINDSILRIINTVIKDDRMVLFKDDIEFFELEVRRVEEDPFNHGLEHCKAVLENARAMAREPVTDEDVGIAEMYLEILFNRMLLSSTRPIVTLYRDDRYVRIRGVDNGRANED